MIPASFKLFRNVDVYVPIGQWSNPALKNRGAALGLHGIGRLKPGVSIAQAQSDLSGVMSRLAITYPDTNRANDAKISSLNVQAATTANPLTANQIRNRRDDASRARERRILERAVGQQRR